MQKDVLKEIDPLIQSVETALDNIRVFLDKAKSKSAQKRKHERYKKRYLKVRFQLYVSGSSQLQKQVNDGSVLDVSAGGMGMDVGADLQIEQGMRLKFSIMKPDNSPILSGTGQVVRAQDPDGEKQTLGVKFQVVQS